MAGFLAMAATMAVAGNPEAGEGTAPRLATTIPAAYFLHLEPSMSESGMSEPAAPSLSLLQAVQRAREHEPGYLSAKANVIASEGKLQQALGGLLPQVTMSLNSNANDRNYVTRDSPIPPAKDGYNSNGGQLNITAPLWRRSNLIAYRQADTSVLQAQLQLQAAEVELLVKLMSAWYDVMSARDAVYAASSQVAAANALMMVQQKGAAIGVFSMPAAEEAQAKYEQAMAESLTAETELQVKIAALEQLVGPLAGFRAPFLSPSMQRIDMKIESLDRWLAAAEQDNPAILAAEKALEAASQEVDKQRAGHWPTIDVVANYGRNGQSAGNFPGQNGYDIKQHAVGLQLNIPIYSGGAQNGKVKEALGMQEKARQDLEATRRTVRLNVKQAWFGWRAAEARQAASLQSRKAALAGVRVAEKGSATGVKTEAELLDAKRLSDAALRDLNKARYDAIVSMVKLKAAAGLIEDEDFQRLNMQMSPEYGGYGNVVLNQEQTAR
ncbi:TolC family outer membrane protein [Noviherbaspirillum agri]